MRLSVQEINDIKQQLLVFDNEAEIYLFGSRVDDTKRGGDIDLLIISKTMTFEDKIKFRVSLYQSLGEQKIDIIIAKTPDESAFVQHAMSSGVKL